MTLEEQIETALDKIRPFIHRDGGDVLFDSVIDGICYVKFIGACEGCSLINETLEEGVSVILLEEVPDLKAVKSVDKKPVQD